MLTPGSPSPGTKNRSIKPTKSLGFVVVHDKKIVARQKANALKPLANDVIVIEVKPEGGEGEITRLRAEMIKQIQEQQKGFIISEAILTCEFNAGFSGQNIATIVPLLTTFPETNIHSFRLREVIGTGDQTGAIKEITPSLLARGCLPLTADAAKTIAADPDGPESFIRLAKQLAKLEKDQKSSPAQPRRDLHVRVSSLEASTGALTASPSPAFLAGNPQPQPTKTIANPTHERKNSKPGP